MLLVIISAAILFYQHNGRKQILKIDLVQFFYAFVLTPAIYLWLKISLYILMKNYLQVSSLQFSIFDSVLSVVFLFVQSFVAIHSVTKSFKLEKDADPLHDLLEHSEYFHLWVTHAVIYLLVPFLIGLLGISNLFYPLDMGLTEWQNTLGLILLVILSIIIGLIAPIVINFNYGAKQAPTVKNLIRLVYVIFFMGPFILFLIFTPEFSLNYGFFWFNFLSFMIINIANFLLGDSRLIKNLSDKFEMETKF